MEGDVVLVPVDITPGVVPVLQKFGPKEPNHPTRGGTCLLCQEPFRTGNYTTILPLGPGYDDDAQAACRAGKPYHGIGTEVHWGCGTGKLDIDIVVPN
jgi:hypothetical protein